MPKAETTAKIDVTLADWEWQLFDDLAGGMTRPAFVSMLVRYGLAHTRDAFGEHVDRVYEKHEAKKRARPR